MHFDDAERRRRLGVRHALTEPVSTTEDVVEAVGALHSTDPAAMVVSALARLAAPEITDVERALYTDRTVTRVLAMRRTVFAVPTRLVPATLAATRRSVAEPERRKLIRFVAESAIADPDFLERADAAACAAYPGLGQFSSGDLAAADPLLATRVEVGAGTKYATSQSIASRLLTVHSAEGHVVRTRPAGTWASSQFRWAAMASWLPDLPLAPAPAEARAHVARHWLARFGPAPPADLQWWTGWTKTDTTRAIADIAATEVTTEAGPAVILADDLDSTPETGPWVALLPALDPTTMGWKQRDWYLGPLAGQVFDAVGNAGPTVWSDGRIVGGWAMRDDGTVATEILTDIGREATAAIDARAHDVQTLLAGSVLKARARRWTAVEARLRA